MSTETSIQPLTPLATRLSSNLVRGPLFFLFTGVCGSMSLAVSCLEKNGSRQHAIARLWARMSLWAAGAPVKVIGRDNLVPVAVYASNHTSFMDTPLVFSGLPFQFRILAKQSLWKWPFIGWHLNRSGQIPIDEATNSSAVAGLNRAIRAVKDGMPVFIFPEGGRTQDGQMRPFMKGPAYIAIRARVPLVPLALVGTYELLPIHTHHFRPRPVKLIIGKPIDTSAYSIRQVDELTARLRSEILDLYQQHAEPGDLPAVLTPPTESPTDEATADESPTGEAMTSAEAGREDR
jgi:1-acyl-sn-glycerol-3-phosphate acyltransferase